MAKLVIIGCLLIATTLAFPADNENLDKATVNDVAVNTVASEQQKKPEDQIDSKPKGTSSIEITGLSTGLDATQPPTNTHFVPQRASSMFARFIDDIFQIPITVLQSVAKLITNPFTQTKKNPDATVAVAAAS